ncbi:MAG: hypothetical protein ACTSO8_06975 [Promethearchaeota archaeon]
MEKPSSKKIRSYLTDRIEEIKAGTFVLSYDQIRDLPEFSGIKERAFNIARNKWYEDNFHMSFRAFSPLKAREKESNSGVEKAILKGKRKWGIASMIIGMISIVYGTFFIPRYSFLIIGSFFFTALGIILTVIGLILIIYYSSKMSV